MSFSDMNPDSKTETFLNNLHIEEGTNVKKSTSYQHFNSFNKKIIRNTLLKFDSRY